MTKKITNIGIKFKKPTDDERMLTAVPKSSGCYNHQYLIDAEANEVTCSKCDKVFNPMAVLVALTREESKCIKIYHRSVYVM